MELFVDSRYTSPYALSVFVALREKGVPFTIRTVDLHARDHVRPEFRARSLTSRVPVIEHDGIALSESSAITEYLEEIFPPPAHAPLYPADPIARARARQIQAWLRSDLLPLREERPTTVLFHQRSDQPLSDQARQSVQKLVQAADALLPPGAAHLFDAWCIADTDLAIMLNRLVANGDDVPERLAEYVRQQWQRPAVQAWVALAANAAAR